MIPKGAGYLTGVLPLLGSGKLKVSRLRRVAVDGVMSSRQDYLALTL